MAITVVTTVLLGSSPALVHRGRARRQDLVAVDHVAGGVGEQRAVGVAVVRDTGVGAEAHDLGGDDLGVQRAAPVVDVAPSGASKIACTVAPSRRRTSGETPLAEPFAQSTTTVQARRAAPRRRRRDAAGTAALVDRAAACGRPGRRAGARPATASISSSRSSDSLIPSPAKNLMPLSGGLWEAEITDAGARRGRS